MCYSRICDNRLHIENDSTELLSQQCHMPKEADPITFFYN